MVAQAEQCKQLAQVLTLTKRMLILAGDGQWDEVAECEIERRGDLAACFNDNYPAADADLYAEAMAALLHLNEELMSKLKVARNEVLEQGREYSRQVGALNSYREVGANP